MSPPVRLVGADMDEQLTIIRTIFFYLLAIHIVAFDLIGLYFLYTAVQ